MVGLGCFVVFKGTEGKRNQSVHSYIRSFPELLAGLLYPALCLFCLSWLAGPQSCCHCQRVYPWAVSAPLFSQTLGKQDMLAWGGRCSAALLLPQLLAPCHVQGSSALNLPDTKITSCIITFLDHGKHSCLSDAQKMDV